MSEPKMGKTVRAIVETYRGAIADVTDITDTSTIVYPEKISTFCDINRCKSGRKAAYFINRIGNSAESRLSLCETCLTTIILSVPEQFKEALLKNKVVTEHFNEVLSAFNDAELEYTSTIATLESKIDDLEGDVKDLRAALQLARLAAVEKGKNTTEETATEITIADRNEEELTPDTPIESDTANEKVKHTGKGRGHAKSE